MDKLIKEELKIISPDTRIQGDALSWLSSLLDAISKCQEKDDNLKNWITSNLAGELAKHAISEMNKTTTSKSKKVLVYLLDEILELSSSNARSNRRVSITLRDIMIAINQDIELITTFEKCVPLFPHSIKRQNSEHYKVTIKKTKLKETYKGKLSTDFKTGLYSIMVELVDFYYDKLDRKELLELQYDVAEKVVNRARELNPGPSILNYQNLIDAIYKNSNLNLDLEQLFHKTRDYEAIERIGIKSSICFNECIV